MVTRRMTSCVRRHKGTYTYMPVCGLISRHLEGKFNTRAAAVLSSASALIEVKGSGQFFLQFNLLQDSFFSE